jgi:hypothetical protein
MAGPAAASAEAGLAVVAEVGLVAAGVAGF